MTMISHDDEFTPESAILKKEINSQTQIFKKLTILFVYSFWFTISAMQSKMFLLNSSSFIQNCIVEDNV
jgi:hypothetical protein